MSNKLDIRVAISGQSGCGNTTVCRLLAERLGLTMVNYTFRQIAKERGVTFEQICRLAEKSDDIDRQVDQTQVKLALEQPSVLGSRLAIWMLDSADLKVFLYASPEIRAKRIMEREGGTLEQQMKATSERDKRDNKRYKRLYNIDIQNYKHADLAVNTNRLTAKHVTDIIEQAVLTIMDKQKGKPQ